MKCRRGGVRHMPEYAAINKPGYPGRIPLNSVDMITR